MSERQPIKPRRRTDVLCKTLGSEGVIFDPKTDTTHALNAASLLIWNLCDGTRDAGDIAAALRQQFDVSGEQAERDVRTIVVRLQAEGLLEAPTP
jgi:hypothetical protein